MPAPIASASADAPFVVTPDYGGDVASAYADAGIVNLHTDRSQEQDIPWSGPTPPRLRKLTHFRAPGLGDPMWSGQCVYDVAGVSPSYSEYDQADALARDDELTYSVTAGVMKMSDQLNVGEPTTTRRSRVAAQFDSAPSAAFFQGFANVRWSGTLAGYGLAPRPLIRPRPLAQNFNPNQVGSKELHKATQYLPVPPMGSLTGYYGSGEKVI